MKKLINILIALSLILIIGCETDDDDDPAIAPTPTPTPIVDASKSNVKIMFEHVFGNMSTTFNLNTKYKTENGDTISATKLAYFISNVKLTKDNGDVFTETKSYHLVQKEDGQMMDMFQLLNVPIGTYNKIEFSIGVDAGANTTNDQDGDLDPSKNPSMVWNWDTGYKFFVFEGNYISKNENSGGLIHHIGRDANYKTLTFDGFNLTVASSTTDEIHFMVDVSQIWKNPTTLDIENYTSVKGGTEASNLANNYTKGMFMQHHAN